MADSDTTEGGEHAADHVDLLDPDPLDGTPADVALTDPSLYLNRELSELAFHRRVLNEAADDRTPLLDRVRFLSIVTRNLDEFCMKRIGGLKQQLAAGVVERTVDGQTPGEQWATALDEAGDLLDEANDIYHDAVEPALAEAGIHVAEYDDLTSDERAALRTYFEDAVLPTLTPLTVDPTRSFPFISNLSLSLAVLTEGEDGAEKFSRVKVPGNRPRLVRVDDPGAIQRGGPAPPSGDLRVVPLAEVVGANLDLLFPNVDIVDWAPFRVTRNAEVRRNEDVAEGLIESIEGVIRARRFATVVRLEVGAGMPDRARELLVENLALDEREVFERDPPLDFRDFAPLVDLDRPALKRADWSPRPHPRLADPEADVFEEVADRDLLVHHPYQSFDDTVQRFLDAAATDPDVLAIKAAIYRTGEDSRVIESLIEAARNGKQVAVMVELKARFDEATNLRWVRRLEEEGVHVATGSFGLKAHSKVALVVRDEGDSVERYAHVGTGNYHAGTARLYVDLGLMTADRQIGDDLVRVFNSFTGHGTTTEYEKLLVAPHALRQRFVELIDREIDHARAGRDARLVAKMNALEDPRMVRKLYEASQAGVDVELFVRGICRLRPGVEGVSENVTVTSVVGRFLEHSRIYYFENDGDPDYFIGSADWMTRNLDRRVEVVAPIEDPDHRAELDWVLDAYRADNRNAWALGPDGTYEQRHPGPDGEERSVHEQLMARARAAAEEPRDRDGV
jgi:polyphosphate kinase